ncbi:exonuclease phage-type/recb c-terminal domain-containing protein [Holotrichia oblita]|uniref:Exonuclease phage-type/recb c-terminal domain-containing protein n=1 Tax=Holotrichia oblita TaxID=644536 RepID=A0ACB9STR5_HOLOL|nr:exonuclease phage-type/recb c-terminal domain-containing protein [Holotrichia oblita]
MRLLVEQNIMSTIRQHELSIEEDICHAKDISGNRIVDINYILKWATTLQYNHAKICSTGTLILKKEQRFGLVSKFTFQCNLCERQYKYATEDPTKPNSTINNGAVWKDALWQELHTAGEEERLLAIEKGHVIENVPWITVYLDGGWSKRSYGHRYNAASGVVTPEEIEQISAATIGQFNNERYMSERNFRLTASNFGSVVKRRSNTACHNLVKKVLHGDIVHSEAINYGKIKESVAINKFEKALGKNVQPAGLYIDPVHTFLAASPDGIIDSDHIVEVKCLYKVAKSGLTLENAIHTIPILCVEVSDGKISLKKRHNYYYQIQGQLNIRKRKLYYFVVFIDETQPLFIEEIYRDEQLCRNLMVPKLRQFFLGCFLPERIQQLM